MRDKWILLHFDVFFCPFSSILYRERADHMDSLRKQKRDCSNQCGLYCLPFSLAGEGEAPVCPLSLPSFILCWLPCLFQLLAASLLTLQRERGRGGERELHSSILCHRGQGERDRAEDHMVAFFWVCDSFRL